MLRQSSIILAGLALMVLLGCSGSDGPPRYRVQGSVTYAGEPVPAGRVVFEPHGAAGERGPQGFARIENGRYDTADGGKGSVGGKQIIVVDGYDGKQIDGDSLLGRRLFPRHTEQADLPAESTTLDITIPAGRQAAGR